MKKRQPPEVSVPELQSGLGYLRGSSYCKYTTNLIPIMRSSRQVFEGIKQEVRVCNKTSIA